ncbi:hypothetical protein NXH67_05680 [Butyrivibrio sp. DSM 10294]|uniref:hypothetical protein n=1 Tax=Butyrivibrio sp. DSM 10294 TaxID=2972457 RepID=UPI00234EE53A|nr:hypothetical protein [Butyrivibrio sp. DSM 10294]MDC7293004.1 hypothetical protein [Butyrivibrio sp. DSM 10294]
MLDTNALYAYIGREKLGLKSDAKIDYNALKTFLDSKVTDKALAASAYIEAMVKYRNEILYAKRVGTVPNVVHFLAT